MLSPFRTSRGKEWLYEVKFDGYRSQVARWKNGSALYFKELELSQVPARKCPRCRNNVRLRLGMIAALYGRGEIKMKKKRLLLWALLLVVLASEGCGTMRGMGEDIQSLGRAVKRTFSDG